MRRSPPLLGGADVARALVAELSIALLLQSVGEEKGELERLAGVETRVAMRMVAIGEARLADRLGAADAFGDVLPGHLEMDAAGIGAFGVVHGEEALNLGQDAVEDARLIAVGRGHRVAVHGIAAPDDLAALTLDRADERRQL